MLLYVINIIYKIHHTYNIGCISSNEAASLFVERSIASISRNRLCQYAIARRAGWLLYRFIRVKRDSKIRASQTIEDSKEDSTSVLFYFTKIAETPCSHVRGSPFVCVFPYHPLLEVARLESGITE